MSGRTKIWTVGEAIKWTSSLFSSKGVGNGRLEAEVLLSQVLGWDRVRLYLEFSRPLEANERTRYRGLVRRRAAGEPLQHLLGYQQFRYLKLAVGPKAFIPRPETELLVDAAKRIIRSWPRERPLVADVGTGSGAVALSLAYEIEHVDVVGIDISADALGIARENAKANKLESRIRFLEGYMLEPLAAHGVGPADILVSNPPYVPSSELQSLPPEVRSEPLPALDGGEDGLRYYRELASGREPAVARRAAIILEIGMGQSELVRSILEEAGWAGVRIHPDLAGIPRVVEAYKKET